MIDGAKIVFAHLRKYSAVYLSFAFSAVASYVVVSWDVKFSVDEFAMEKTLAILMMSQIEGFYIFIPYLIAMTTESRTESQVWLDRGLVAALFIASVTPAALQVSSKFIDQASASAMSEPQAPKSPASAETIEEQIRENNRTIRSLYGQEQNGTVKYQIWAITEDNRKLTTAKTNRINAQDQFDKDYRAYEDALKTYNETSAKNGWTGFAQTVKILFSFLVVIIIQLANARNVNLGSNRLKQIRSGVITTQKKEQGVKDETRSVKPEPEPEPAVPQAGTQQSPEEPGEPGYNTHPDKPNESDIKKKTSPSWGSSTIGKLYSQT